MSAACVTPVLANSAGALLADGVGLAESAGVSWRASAGVESSKLDLRSGGGAACGRGTFAAARILCGEPVMEPPRSAVLHGGGGRARRGCPELCADGAWARLP